MKRRQYVWILVTTGLLGLGCGVESADELFFKGERATHEVASYPQAEQYLIKFLDHYPDDPRTDVALQALARVLMNEKKNDAAIARYEELIRRFPDSRYNAQSQFMVAYIYDHIQNYEQARTAYLKVIQNYPDSDLEDDAKISIQNMGKSPEKWLFPDSMEVGKDSPESRVQSPE